MKKRYTFLCWNNDCKRKYTLFREITKEQVVTVACPYCNVEAVVDLKPYRKEKKTVMRGDDNDEQSLGFELELPDIIPTQKPE
jgi:DNA-directed RNA polymerase subunit RPC12/RpoP